MENDRLGVLSPTIHARDIGGAAETATLQDSRDGRSPLPRHARQPSGAKRLGRSSRFSPPRGDLDEVTEFVGSFCGVVDGGGDLAADEFAKAGAQAVDGDFYGGDGEAELLG